MSNTKMVLNDNLPSAKDSPGQDQAAGNTSNIEDGRNKMSQRSFKTSKNTSSNAEADGSPEEQTGLLRNIYRLSKRKLSFSPPKPSDKDVTKVMSNENTANNLREEVECMEDETVENTKSPLSAMLPESKRMSNTEMESNDNLPSAKGSPGQGQVTGDTPEIEDGRNKMSQRSFKTSKNTSSNAEADGSPEEQTGLLRNIYRLSKRRFSFTPPKPSDKDVTKVMSNENTANNLSEEVECMEDETVENTKSPLSAMLPESKTMSNTEMELNDNLPSAKGSPGQGQVTGDTPDIVDGRNKMSQRSFKTSKNTSSNAEADGSPEEQTGLLRNIYRLSKRRFSFTPPKPSDKAVTKVMLNENTANNLSEEVECMEDETVENTKSPLSEALPKSKTMSNTKMVLNDNLPSAKDSPGQGQAAGNTSNIEDGRNKMSQRSFKTSKNTSSNAEAKVPDGSPEEQTGLLRSIYRLSKRKLSFSPPKPPDKDVTKVMSNENPANNLSEEVECMEDKTVENTKSPLSVMEINQLITKKMFLDANENINKMEKELLNERKPTKDEEYHQQYMVEVRDLNLLCDSLVGQMMSIVANSLTVAKENGYYLCWIMKVVEMEEATDKEWQEHKNLSAIECFRRPRKWRELWRKTVTKSVKDRIDNVPLPAKEKVPCMAQHLSDIQEVIVEDLKTVKNFIQKCYPESYNIFSMYVKCYHQTVASHLESVLQKQLEPNDLYSLLNWIIHTYKSDAVMNHPELLPEVDIEGLGPLLDETILKNIMDKYIEALKLTVPVWMKNAVKEDEAKWSESETYVPEIMMGCYHSHIASDLSEIVHAHLNESGKISKDLKEKVLCYCLKELTNLIHCYQEDLKVRKQSAPDPLPLLIVSINSYIDLGESIKTLKEDNSASLDEVEKALNEALCELNKILSDDLLFKVLHRFKKIMKNKQLSSREDIDQLMSMTGKYCNELRKMKEANYQVVISDLHYQFVREYITALMKIKKTSSKHLTAAKIREELGAINKMYEEFGSTALWLFQITQHLFDFIDGDESELESKLCALFEGCPEIGEEHISALLHIRGISKGQKKTNLMKYFNQLKKNAKDPIETMHPFLFEK